MDIHIAPAENGTTDLTFDLGGSKLRVRLRDEELHELHDEIIGKVQP